MYCILTVTMMGSELRWSFTAHDDVADLPLMMMSWWRHASTYLSNTTMCFLAAAETATSSTRKTFKSVKVKKNNNNNLYKRWVDKKRRTSHLDLSCCSKDAEQDTADKEKRMKLPVIVRVSCRSIQHTCSAGCCLPRSVRLASSLRHWPPCWVTSHKDAARSSDCVCKHQSLDHWVACCASCSNRSCSSSARRSVMIVRRLPLSSSRHTHS